MNGANNAAPPACPNRYNARMRIISLQFGSNGNSIYVEAGGVRLLFDAGLSGTLVRERLAVHGRDVSTVDAVLLESNYDPEMLLQGSYPEFLKERIQGLGGHISNIEAAELLLAASSPRLHGPVWLTSPTTTTRRTWPSKPTGRSSRTGCRSTSLPDTGLRACWNCELPLNQAGGTRRHQLAGQTIIGLFLPGGKDTCS